MIRILKRGRSGAPGTPALKAFLAPLLAEVGRPSAELSLLLTTDEEIAQLNRDYRGIDAPTDVLSFPQGEDGENDLLGDIVISVDTAKAQALDKGHSLEQEIEILLVHGLLHLVGYDHERSSKEAARMKRAEAKLLGRVGLV